MCSKNKAQRFLGSWFALGEIIKLVMGFIKKNYYWLIFSVILILTISFLIFQKGLWVYLDLSYAAATLFNNGPSFGAISRNLSSVTAFGYDNTQLFATRFLNILSEVIISRLFGNLAQIFYFITYFILSFVLVKKCLALAFEENSSFFGALVYTFNPVSIYLLNEAGFFFIYFSLPLIVYAFVRYFQNEEIGYVYVLMFSIGITLLTSYARISFIYFGIIALLAVLFYKEVLKILIHEKKKLAILAGVTFLVIFPIFFSFAHPHLVGDSEYFAGISNYTDAFIKSGNYAYQNNIDLNSFQGFILTELTANFSAKVQGSLFFIFFSMAYVLGVIIFAVYILRKRIIEKTHLKLATGFLVILGVSISLKMLASFTSKDIFIKITYVYLPFLANTTFWVMVGFISGFSGLLAFIFFYSSEKEKKSVLFLTLAYILLSIYPLITFPSNAKLKTISMSDIPPEYQLFFQGKRQEAALFFPGKNLYFDWSPYPLDISQGKYFKDIFSNNVRLVNDKQAKLSTGLSGLLTNSSLSNAYFFNGKNVFVFKDIRNEDQNFDYFAKKNYPQLSKIYYDRMKKNENFLLAEDNAHFARFVQKNASLADFSLYSPKTVLMIDPDKFFDQDVIDINRRAILVDSAAFKKPKDLRSVEPNQNINISFKYSLDDTTRYVVKIENAVSSKPFLVQLNQTFGMSWKIKWVNKKYFESKKCLDGWQQFPLTNNSSCLTDFSLFDLNDFHLFFAPSVNNKDHFEGNFVGNAWLVRQKDIPQDLENKKDLYAVIICEKQPYYALTIIITGLTLTILLLIITKQFVDKKQKSTK